MKRLGRNEAIPALEMGFDHEIALLRAGQRRIVKMEFSSRSRIELAQSLGFTCESADGTYGLDPASADVVYGTGEFKTVFVGNPVDVQRAIELESVEQGPDPEKRQEAMMELGRLLGYPSCCTESYRQQATQDESASFARLLGRNDAVEGHFANNLFVLDHQLISHFPCHLGCKKSAEVGLTALELCRRQSVAHADALEELLRSPIQVWDRFRVHAKHPTLGSLYADNLSAEPRLRNHEGLRQFLSELPLLPDDGTWVYWSD